MLDWKITDAPRPDEARPETAAPSHSVQHSKSRGAWILLDSIVVLIIVGAEFYSGSTC